MILFIGIGGALGTLFRLSINFLSFSMEFPISTLMVNVIGSTILGMLAGYVLERNIAEHWKNAIGVGFCGSFTTMSTLAYDFHYLIHNGKMFLSILYLFVSVTAGLFLAVVGLSIGQRLALRKQRREREVAEKS
jgi:CrcB protein